MHVALELFAIEKEEERWLRGAADGAGTTMMLPRRLFLPLLLLLSAVSCQLQAGAIGSGQCDLAGSWVHIPASAFDHETSPMWTNQACVYQWTRQPAGGFRVEAPPLTCWLGDLQVGSTITASAAALSFAVNTSLTQAGAVDLGCQRVDMADGSLYVRSESGEHPFFMPAHEWLRVAASWLGRAAHVTFEDGSHHLTPGYPTNYDGQWMRDGFYGISMLWPVANATHRADFATSAGWMFSHARGGDGLMPQACPPSGHCQYGQAGTPPVEEQYFRVCNGTQGAAGWRHCQDLDSAGFAVKLAHHIWHHLESAEAKTFYMQWAAALERGMNATTHDPAGSGLLWSNTTSPNVGYVRSPRHTMRLSLATA